MEDLEVSYGTETIESQRAVVEYICITEVGGEFIPFDAECTGSSRNAEMSRLGIDLTGSWAVAHRSVRDWKYEIAGSNGDLIADLRARLRNR